MSLARSPERSAPQDSGALKPDKDREERRLSFPKAAKGVLSFVLPKDYFYVQDRPPKIQIPDEPERKRQPPPPGGAKKDEPLKSEPLKSTPYRFAHPLDDVYQKHPAAIPAVEATCDRIRELVNKRDIAIFRAVCDKRFLEKDGATLALETAFEAAKKGFADAVANDKTGGVAEINKQLKPFMQKLELTALPITDPKEVAELKATLGRILPGAERIALEKTKVKGVETEFVTQEKLSSIREYLYATARSTKDLFDLSAALGYLGPKGSPELSVGAKTPADRRQKVEAIIARYKGKPEERAAVKRRDEILNTATTFLGREVWPPTAGTNPDTERTLLRAYNQRKKLDEELRSLELKFVEHMYLGVKYKDKMVPAYYLWHVEEKDNKNFIPGVKSAFTTFNTECKKVFEGFRTALAAAKVPESQNLPVQQKVWGSLSRSVNDVHYRFRYYQIR